MMKKPDTILNEIYETRRKIEEKTKGMTAQERTDYFNQYGRALAQKYGFEIFPNNEEQLAVSETKAKYEINKNKSED